MNLILEKSKFVEFYTYLDPIFETAPELTAFTYLVSDLESNCANERLFDGAIISGVELREIVQRQKTQFIWGVFSAFDKKPVVAAELPFADGNPDFWRGTPRPQLPDARFEIVCWDAGATLFIGIDSTIAGKLRQRYPDILDLDEENRKRRNRCR